MPAGRPPKYETADELQKKIDEYFEHIRGEINPAFIEYYENIRELRQAGDDLKGIEDEIPNKWLRYPERPKITSLCIFIGFESRQAFYHLEEKEEFRYTIKMAHQKIEESYEDLLIDHKNPAGSIFALKNLGWKDKIEQDVNLHVEKPVLQDLTKKD